MARRLGGLALWIPVASALGACMVSVQPAGLPEHAKPRRMEGVSPGPAELADLISYRILSRADFRAKAPRAEVAKHAHEMGAYTCALLPPQVTREIEVDSAVRSALAAVLEINTRFDHDTSAKYAPRKQAEWWTRAEAELRRLPAGRGLAVDGDRVPHSGPAEEPL